MKERGMIFNAEMVNAILSGRKTQTRRPIKWKQTRFTEIAERDDGSLWPWAEDCERGGDIWFACPFGEVGDRIWVRETWQVIHDHIDESSHVEYRTYAPSIPKEKDRYWHAVYAEHFGDESREDRGFPWRPAIHMPRWASRITLEITDVRVERLRGLSEEDAKSEGIIPSAGGVLPGWEYRINFRDLWMDIYGTDNWEANPWVWVIEFKRVEGGAA
ncbi:hypothetical protein IFX79_004089 [Salmonella enterica]|uniref:hypothetical protein n=1 Tax=Salmonella enterica TaxID=28901 RepID=UPI0003BD3927|nr:hypothetical protein [Salmonella enterica]EAU5131733.1 hypothetical protein [Salmonella enterica subsp. enterica serovar Oranienburg]EBK2688439.1 hypothetical protein [Salmonella enterica subsp. enterica serovar Newport]ECJ2211044.1 hypothetical protein [Salmonella enterica subsp. diarizonae]ESG69253.1 hypothetical protein SEEM1594_11205 [Salmonella enterica subsp. enterica serovar Muenchen str. baa1594]OIU98952.1 hypothetical protein APP86_22595 [Salmonella enterica subsp. houtenae]